MTNYLHNKQLQQRKNMTDMDTTSSDTLTSNDGAETTTTTTEAPSTPEVNFRDLLPEEYRDLYPEFKKPEDFVKGYDNLIRKLGNSVSIPKEDATPEELDKFYNKLGRPETPDKYEIELSEDIEYDPEFLNSFKNTAHKLGITQKQAKDMISWYNTEVQRISTNLQKADEERIAKATAELKARWGADYDRKIAEVQGFAKSLAGEKYFESLVKYGNDPDFIYALSELKNKYAKEDRIDTNVKTASSVPDYLEEARKIMREPDYKESSYKQDKVRELFRKIAEQRS